VRHSWAQLLEIGVEAVIAGARSFAAIEEWAAARAQATATGGGTGRAPDEFMFRRVFARLDADALAAVVGAWLWTCTTMVDGRRVIAIDGKTIRGARRRDRDAPHLVAALDHATGTVLGHFPPPVLAVDIPKPHENGTRTLGIPTVADRVAQTVVARHLQEKVEPIFHPDSYGYRPRRSARRRTTRRRPQA